MLIGIAVGCGGLGAHSTANPGAPPPHEGTLVFLQGGKGIIEIVKKKGDAPITGELSFYLYKSAFTPFDSSPESGVLLIDKKRKIPLTTDGNALVTPTGPILFGSKDVDGVIRFELDGETIQVPLGVR